MQTLMKTNRMPAEVISLEQWATHRAGRERSTAIRVLLADGAGLVRAGVRALLEAEPGMAVIAEAGTGEEAVAAAIETRPDVVLMDAGLPGMDGLQATRQILATPGLSHVRVLILSENEPDDHLFDALRAGATGFLLKDTEPGELSRAVRVLAGGGAQLSPCVTRRLLQEFASQPDPKRPTPELLEELTAREREVMTLVALGLSNDEIAERLVVSPATAKTHVSRAMVKLHARDRAKLVVLAYECGLVQPHQPHQPNQPPQPQCEPELVPRRVRQLGQHNNHRVSAPIGSVRAVAPHEASRVRVRAVQLTGASGGFAHRGE